MVKPHNCPRCNCTMLLADVEIEYVEDEYLLKKLYVCYHCGYSITE